MIGFIGTSLQLQSIIQLAVNLDPILTAEASLHSASPSMTACKVKVKVKVTLRLVVYRQSVCLGVEPLETHDQRFFPQLNPCGISPYVTSSMTRRWICLL
jgi:hypothetical protein